jgi:hypothetical protein
MAAPVLLSTKTLATVPFLVIEKQFTAGTDATAFSHGGPAAAPDWVVVRNATTNPTASEAAVYSLTTTQFTLDCEAAAGTVVLTFFWLPQGAGGLTP